MKKKALTILILVASIFLLLSSNSVTALKDHHGDLWHYYYNVSTDLTIWEQNYSGEHPYLDISELTYSISNKNATLKMTCLYELRHNNGYYYYYMHLVNSSDENDYYEAMFTGDLGDVRHFKDGEWVEFEKRVWKIDINSPGNDKNFTATFPIDDPSASYEVRGYTKYRISHHDIWGDWVPDDYFYEQTGFDPDAEPENGDDGTDDTDDSDTGNNKGTPGFEIVILLISLIFTIFWKRKKRNKL